MATETSGWEGWAILELMGHRRLAGYIGEATIGGTSFIRLDVPEAGDNPAATQFYSGGSVYCITPTTEEIARGLALDNHPAPVSRFELPQLAGPKGGQEQRLGIHCSSCGEWADGLRAGDTCPDCGLMMCS